MSHDAQAAEPVKKLTTSVALLMILVAMLFGSFSLILPRHHWTVWRVPAVIGASGAVALMIAWPSRSALRAWIMDGLAAVLGLTAAISGIGIILLITYGLGLHITENRQSAQALMFQLTEPLFLWELLGLAIIPAASGVLGLLIARRRLREMGRTSLAAMAARFSILGPSLSIVVGLAVAVAATYRWITWG